MKDVIKKLAIATPSFRKEHEISRIQQAMEDYFPLDNFASTFKFVQSWIDLERSSAAVQKWCKVIWVDLSSALKMQYNQEKGIKTPGGNNTRVKYNKQEISKRFSLYSTTEQYNNTEQYNKLRPQLQEVKIAVKQIKAKETINKDDPMTKVLLGDLYLPTEENGATKGAVDGDDEF